MSHQPVFRKLSAGKLVFQIVFGDQEILTDLVLVYAHEYVCTRKGHSISMPLGVRVQIYTFIVVGSKQENVDGDTGASCYFGIGLYLFVMYR
jgi:hypothetical protein